jgi:hypothetical protein
MTHGRELRNTARYQGARRRAALEGSVRPLLVTSGVALLPPGGAATEEDTPVPVSASVLARMLIPGDLRRRRVLRRTPSTRC